MYHVPEPILTSPLIGCWWQCKIKIQWNQCPILLFQYYVPSFTTSSQLVYELFSSCSSVTSVLSVEFDGCMRSHSIVRQLISRVQLQNNWQRPDQHFVLLTDSMSVLLLCFTQKTFYLIKPISILTWHCLLQKSAVKGDCNQIVYTEMVCIKCHKVC